MEKEVLNLILVEVREMKSDMSEVKTRLTNIENDMIEVKDRLTNVENDVSEIKERLSNVEETSRFNKEMAQSIMNVVTSHYMEFKKYIKSNDVQHNLYNAKLLQYKKEK